VEHELCPTCGFDGGDFDADRLLDALRRLGPRWGDLLGQAGALVAVRPAPETWSAIEYAAHSRDITTLHLWGVEQALVGDEPVLPEIAADELIQSAAATYAGEDPQTVVGALAEAADRMAEVAGDAGERAWDRGMTLGASRSSVRRLLEHALHDSQHHLADVATGLDSLRGPTR